MIWTLALMLGQFATPLGPKQYHYFSAQPRFTRPAIVTPYGKTTIVPRNGFLPGQIPTGKCSIPLVNAPGVDVKPSTRSMPMVSPREVDPKMVSAAPAPPCENWFGK